MGQNYSQKRNMLLKIEQDLFWGGERRTTRWTDRPRWQRNTTYGRLEQGRLKWKTEFWFSWEGLQLSLSDCDNG